MLNVGDKIQIVNHATRYNGLTGTIRRVAGNGYFRVDMDPNKDWEKEHGWAIGSTWENWHLSGRVLERFVECAFKPSDKVVVSGAHGMLDLFNDLEGTVLEIIGDGECVMVYFQNVSVFGVRPHKLVFPVQWLKPALTEEEKTREALIRLLESYYSDPRWLNSGRADEILKLVGAK